VGNGKVGELAISKLQFLRLHQFCDDGMKYKVMTTTTLHGAAGDISMSTHMNIKHTSIKDTLATLSCM
jgi:hypothetical protein